MPLEINYHNKKVTLSVIYQSPSQSNNEFNSFLSNLEKLVRDIDNRKPALTVTTGDFNTGYVERVFNVPRVLNMPEF